MKYQEKIKQAEETVTQISQGKTFAEIKAYYRDKGYYDHDIEQILRSAKGLLSEKYGVMIRDYLLNGTFKDNKH